MIRFHRFIWLPVMALLLSGCGSMATRKGFYEPISAELLSGRADSAAAMIESARQDGKYGDKDRLVYFLDAGFLNHYAGRWESSNQKLELADIAAEELFTKSISRAATSMLLNDNALEYAGEDYEILYSDLISALNYLQLGDYDGAFVEIRQANLKLNNLEDKYARAARELERGSPDDTARIQIDYDIDKVRFHNDAFARWLSMHMYAADGKWDDANIDYNLLLAAFKEQPHIYGFDPPQVRYEADDGALLSVVALTGLAPVKEALNLRIRTDKDLDLVQVLYDGPGKEDTEYAHFPIDVGADFYFKFAIPQLADRPSQVATLEVLVDGMPVGHLRLIEDVGSVARETFRAKQSMILIRTVARAVVKGLAAHKLKKEADTGGLAGWLKKAAIDVATDLTENADLRCSRFLPGRIYIGDFELPPGVHDVELRYLDRNGHQIGGESFPGFKVSPEGLNLLSASFQG
mgnify:CR=1 FL=1